MASFDSLAPPTAIRTPFVEFWGNGSSESALIIDWMRANALAFQHIDVPADLETKLSLELPAAKIVINGIKGAFSTGAKAIMSEVMEPLIRINESEFKRQIEELLTS